MPRGTTSGSRNDNFFRGCTRAGSDLCDGDCCRGDDGSGAFAVFLITISARVSGTITINARRNDNKQIMRRETRTIFIYFYFYSDYSRALLSASARARVCIHRARYTSVARRVPTLSDDGPPGGRGAGQTKSFPDPATVARRSPPPALQRALAFCLITFPVHYTPCRPFVNVRIILNPRRHARIIIIC